MRITIVGRAPGVNPWRGDQKKSGDVGRGRVGGV